MSAALSFQNQEVFHGDASGQARLSDAQDPCSMPRHRRVLGYARVSSVEQALGTSLRDQQAAITSYAAARGLNVTRFYVEAESAVHEKIERREQMRALMRDARKGDLVLCDKLDRWSRDPEFTYGSVRKLLSDGASFIAVGDQCDPSTQEGDTMLGFRILFAREEHKRIKQRMVGTRQLLRDQGYYVEGLPPFGYRRTHPRGYKGIEKNVLVVIPEEADLVRKLFRQYLTGRSMTRLANEHKLELTFVKNTLHRRLYIGEIENTRGEWIKGRHPPILDADTFARTQTMIEARRLGGPRPRDAVSETSTWILRDVARCIRCDAKMGAAYAGPKDDNRRHYYRCIKRCLSRGNRATNGAFVPVREIETAFAPMILERLEALRDDIARGPEKSEDPKPVAIDFVARRAKLESKREKVLLAFEDGFIDRDKLRAKMSRLDADRLVLDAEEEASTRTAPLASTKVRRTLLRDIGSIRKAWKNAEPIERREIVGYLVLAVRIGRGQEPVAVWRSAEDLAAEVHE